MIRNLLLLTLLVLATPLGAQEVLTRCAGEDASIIVGDTTVTVSGVEPCGSPPPPPPPSGTAPTAEQIHNPVLYYTAADAVADANGRLVSISPRAGVGDMVPLDAAPSVIDSHPNYDERHLFLQGPEKAAFSRMSIPPGHTLVLVYGLYGQTAWMGSVAADASRLTGAVSGDQEVTRINWSANYVWCDGGVTPLTTSSGRHVLVLTRQPADNSITAGELHCRVDGVDRTPATPASDTTRTLFLGHIGQYIPGVDMVLSHPVRWSLLAHYNRLLTGQEILDIEAVLVSP